MHFEWNAKGWRDFILCSITPWKSVFHAQMQQSLNDELDIEEIAAVVTDVNSDDGDKEMDFSAR